MSVMLAPINLEMVTLRERKVPGGERKPPMTIAPLGFNLPPTLKEYQET